MFFEECFSYIKKYSIFFIIWILFGLFYTNCSIGLKGNCFADSIQTVFIGFCGITDINTIVWIYIHAPIWCIVYSYMTEYCSVFFVYNYMRKGNISKVIKELILKTFIYTAIYYLLMYILMYIYLKVNPFDSLVHTFIGDIGITLNVITYFIELVMTSVVIEMLMFIVFLLSKNVELGMILTMVYCLIINLIGYIVGRNTNYGGLLLATTNNLSIRSGNTSELAYTFVSIVYAILIFYVLKIVVKKKCENIVVGEYIKR